MLTNTWGSLNVNVRLPQVFVNMGSGLCAIPGGSRTSSCQRCRIRLIPLNPSIVTPAADDGASNVSPGFRTIRLSNSLIPPRTAVCPNQSRSNVIFQFPDQSTTPKKTRPASSVAVPSSSAKNGTWNGPESPVRLSITNLPGVRF